MAVGDRAAQHVSVRSRLNQNTVRRAIGGIHASDRAIAAARNAEVTTTATGRVIVGERDVPVGVCRAETSVAATITIADSHDGRAVGRPGVAVTLDEHATAGSVVAGGYCAPVVTAHTHGFDAVVTRTADIDTAAGEVGSPTALAVIDAVRDAAALASDCGKRRRLAGRKVQAEPRSSTRHVDVRSTHVAGILATKHSRARARIGRGNRDTVSVNNNVGTDTDLVRIVARITDVNRSRGHCGTTGIGCCAHATAGVLGDAVDLAGPRAAGQGDFTRRSEH